MSVVGNSVDCKAQATSPSWPDNQLVDFFQFVSLFSVEVGDRVFTKILTGDLGLDVHRSAGRMPAEGDHQQNDLNQLFWFAREHVITLTSNIKAQPQRRLSADVGWER
jgi:hypothetical protein